MEIFKTQKKFVNGWSISSDYSEFGQKGDVCFIYYEGDKRKRTTIPYKDQWYFYVKKTDESLAALKELGVKTAIGKDWVRVYFPKLSFNDQAVTNFVRGLEAKGIVTYEADVSPLKRLCLDKDVQIEDWDKLNVLYFDIETDDSTGGIVIGRDRILSFAGVDSNGREYYIDDADESTLLKNVNRLLRQFDMLVGWNSKDFDIPYLLARMKVHKISGDYLWNILHEDMMKRVQYFYSKDPEARQEITSYGLDFISQYFLKEGKVAHTEKIIELYNNDRPKFKEYNLQDCKLLLKLEKKLGTIALTHHLFQICQVFPQNWSMVKAIDNFILSDANKRGIHYVTNYAQMFKDGDESERPESQYLGAYVIDPKPGLYRNVFVLDFKSLYPNIIRTFNISPETLSAGSDLTIPTVWYEGRQHGGQTYSATPGIIPTKIGSLLEERAAIRKALAKEEDKAKKANLNVKQLVVKELANSIYGVMGNKWFRSFSIDLAESITSTGRYLLDFVKDFVALGGYEVIYGDTDSTFIVIKDEIDMQKFCDDINTAIAAHLKDKFGVTKSYIEIGLDKHFPSFLIESKKKYAGVKDGKVKMVGMECIKRDTIKMASTAQHILIELLLREGTDLEKSKAMVDALKFNILTNQIPAEEIVVRKRIGKALEDYKNEGLHVKIAKQLAQTEKNVSNRGQTVSYIITSGSGKDEKLDGIPVDQYTGVFDRNYYWDNVIFPMMDRVLTVVFPDERWDHYYTFHDKLSSRKGKEAGELPRPKVKRTRSGSKSTKAAGERIGKAEGGREQQPGLDV